MPEETAPKRMVGIFLFELETGKMPDLELLARQVSKLLAGLSCGWSVVYYPPTGTVPAPIAARWRVNVANANLREGPGTTFPIIGLARQGELLTEVSTQSGWIRTDRGWISQSLCILLPKT